LWTPLQTWSVPGFPQNLHQVALLVWETDLPFSEEPYILAVVPESGAQR